MNKFNTHNPPCSVTIPDLKMRKIKAQRLNKLPKAMILNKWWSWGLPDFRAFAFNQLSYQ